MCDTNNNDINFKEEETEVEDIEKIKKRLKQLNNPKNKKYIYYYKDGKFKRKKKENN